MFSRVSLPENIPGYFILFDRITVEQNDLLKNIDILTAGQEHAAPLGLENKWWA